MTAAQLILIVVTLAGVGIVAGGADAWAWERLVDFWEWWEKK